MPRVLSSRLCLCKIYFPPLPCKLRLRKSDHAGWLFSTSRPVKIVRSSSGASVMAPFAKTRIPWRIPIVLALAPLLAHGGVGENAAQKSTCLSGISAHSPQDDSVHGWACFSIYLATSTYRQVGGSSRRVQKCVFHSGKWMVQSK